MREEKVRPVKVVKYLLAGIMLCLAVGAGGFLIGRRAAAEPAPEISAVVLENRLTELRELVSVCYHYTNMAQFESSGTFYGVKIPFTTKRFILTYDGVIKAGVDLGEAALEVSGLSVRVKLPEAEILSHELDGDSVEIFDEKTSIFNPFTIEDFTSFQEEQKAAAAEKAVERGLLEEAGESARDAVRMLLEPVLPEGASLTVE